MRKFNISNLISLYNSFLKDGAYCSHQFVIMDKDDKPNFAETLRIKALTSCGFRDNISSCLKK